MNKDEIRSANIRLGNKLYTLFALRSFEDWDKDFVSRRGSLDRLVLKNFDLFNEEYVEYIWDSLETLYADLLLTFLIFCYDKNSEEEAIDYVDNGRVAYAKWLKDKGYSEEFVLDKLKNLREYTESVLEDEDYKSLEDGGLTDVVEVSKWVFIDKCLEEYRNRVEADVSIEDMNEVIEKLALYVNEIIFYLAEQFKKLDSKKTDILLEDVKDFTDNY